MAQRQLALGTREATSAQNNVTKGVQGLEWPAGSAFGGVAARAILCRLHDSFTQLGSVPHESVTDTVSGVVGGWEHNQPILNIRFVDFAAYYADRQRVNDRTRDRGRDERCPDNIGWCSSPREVMTAYAAINIEERKIYGHPMSAYTRKVLMTLAETNTPHELVMVDFAEGEHKQPPHLAGQPFGKIPALEDAGLELYESRAISRYINEKVGGALVPSDVADRARMEQWISIETSNFTGPVMAAATASTWGSRSRPTIYLPLLAHVFAAEPGAYAAQPALAFRLVNLARSMFVGGKLDCLWDALTIQLDGAAARSPPRPARRSGPRGTPRRRRRRRRIEPAPETRPRASP